MHPGTGVRSLNAGEGDRIAEHRGEDGRAKLWTTWRLLQLRRASPALFRGGGYQPLAVRGPRADHAIAFERRLGDESVVAVAGRFFAALRAASAPGRIDRAEWARTMLELPGVQPGAVLENVLTGTPLVARADGLLLDEALVELPGAVLRLRR